MEVIIMKKIVKMVFVCICVGVLVIGLQIIKSSVDYMMMDYSQRLKSQIKHEQQIFSDGIFDHVEVRRSWYSLNPEDWSYYVTLKGSNDVLIYHYDKYKKFILQDNDK